MRSRIVGVARVVAVVLAAALGIAGCSIGSLGNLPASGYPLQVEFSSVLNLPVGARVTMRGTDIGSVEGVRTGDAGRAVVDATVQDGVRIPKGTKADLRQNTVLGDIYISLEPPAEAAEDLPRGGTIPLADTTLGPQIEDVLSTMATFINGGSVTALQDSLVDLQRRLPASETETRELAGFLTSQTHDLAVQTDQLGRLLSGTEAVAARITTMRKEFSFLFSDLGRERIRVLNPALQAAFGIFTQVKALMDGVLPLTPFIQKLNPFLEKTLPLLREWSPTPEEWRGNVGDFVRVFGDRIQAFWNRGGAINVQKVTMGGDQPQDRVADVTRLLRMMGAVR